MAFCSNCGDAVAPEDAACGTCGCPRAPERPGAGPSGTTEPLAVASLVCGIAGFVILPFVGSVAAIILGTVARARLRKDPTRAGARQARTGLILGWTGAILVVAVFTAILIGLIIAANPEAG